MSGSVTLGLAPMEGVSELPFRLWIAHTSAPAFASTPFLRATDTFPSHIPLDFIAELSQGWDCGYALIPQVMASDPRDFVRTSKLLLAHASFVDLNCGCPSPNPVSGGAGSSLLKEPQQFLNFAEHLAAELPPQSFSIKMRTGFDDSAHFESLTSGLQRLPLRQLTIHGRTRRDRYDGASRWDLIQQAAERLPCPVVGSGDILGLASLRRIRRMAPAISRFIVGRGALRNPWIFEELRSEQPVVIRRSLLQNALACFGLLTELGLNHQIDRLEPLIKRGLWQKPALVDPAAWSELYAALSIAHSGEVQDHAALAIDRISLGRVKMVWNYLRSSLPAAFFEPQLLRARSLGQLLQGLADLDPADEPFTVCHRPEWDWLYTSSRQKPETAAALN